MGLIRSRAWALLAFLALLCAGPVPLAAAAELVMFTRDGCPWCARFEREVAACPPIVSCYSTTGQSDYVMRVLVRDIKAYDRFLHDTVFKLPGVTHVRSSMVLREVKAQGRLPIEVPAGGAGG